MIAVHDTVFIAHHTCLGADCGCATPIAPTHNRYCVMSAFSVSTLEHSFSSMDAAKHYVRAFSRDRQTYIHDTLTDTVH